MRQRTLVISAISLSRSRSKKLAASASCVGAVAIVGEEARPAPASRLSRAMGGGVGRRKELHQWGGRTRLRNSSGLSLARMRPGAAGRAGALGIGALGALGRFCRVMSCVSHGTYAAAPAPKVLEAVGDEVHVLVAREGRLGVVLVHSGQPEHEAAAGTQKRIRIRQQVVDQLRQVVRLGRWEVVGAPGLVRARTCGPVCRLP